LYALALPIAYIRIVELVFSTIGQWEIPLRAMPYLHIG